jgi:micrococcal nuclease
VRSRRCSAKLLSRRALAFCVLALAGCGGADGGELTGVVDRVSDGDTIRLEDGTRVRLVQIDAPEVAARECFGEDASRALLSLIPPGTEVRVVHDEELDRVDRFGRRLGYVFRGETNVNLELVSRGAAAPYFFRGDRGRFADELLRAARCARSERRGLWRACPRTSLDPEAAIATA